MEQKNSSDIKHSAGRMHLHVFKAILCLNIVSAMHISIDIGARMAYKITMYFILFLVFAVLKGRGGITVNYNMMDSKSTALQSL